jgi:hypothetical protein
MMIGVGLVGPASAQRAIAPAAPSYATIVRTMDATRNGWGQTPPEAAAGWNSYFDEVRRELDAYASAKTSNDRLGPLNRIWRLSTGLEDVAWVPAVELREALRSWLRPRVRLAWAERRLVDALDGRTASPEDEANRKNWNTFVDAKLGGALRDYEAAKTVQSRQESLKRLRASLGSLRQTNPWAYSSELQAAADDLFNGPNLDISADAASLYPVLSNQVVTSGPIVRHGYVSQVTAGPYAGFGLVSSDQGIAFNNSQYLTSVTPITDFQNQVARDEKGQKAAKIYQFSATSTDQGMMTVTAILTPFGVQLMPNSSHNVDALICVAPIPGKGLTRMIASAIGLGPQKIVDKTYESSIGRIRQNVDKEAAEEAAERSGVAQAQQNAKLGQFLRGDGNLTVKDISVVGLTLRSRPENALIGGTLKWASGIEQGGADHPQPPKFLQPAAGVSADIHLASVANNLVGGYLSSPQVAGVQNLMIETRKVTPGTAPKDAVKITKNVDYSTYVKQVDAAAALNNPDTQVIRIKRPKDAPDFAVDATGHLVVIAHDLELDIPVPAQVAKSGLGGAAAKVYRLVAPTAEFVFDIKPVTQPDGSIRLTGNLKDFSPAPGSKVYALNDDESKALPLDPFRSIFIFQGFATAIRAKPLDIPLENVKLRGYNISTISDLDPTGWMRIVLTPTGERPMAQAAP